MTVALTQDARDDLERYLRGVKAALRGHPAVDADEVEGDIRGHVDAELAEREQPVGADGLRAVLERLGAPGQWVPSEELPWWKRALDRLHTGPEDWRLAYLTLVTLVGGFLFPPLFVVSPLLARATLAQLEACGEPIGPRRWLVYPPLVLWYGAFGLLLTFAPLLPVAALATNPPTRADLAALLPEPFWAAFASGVALALGAWWTLVGLALGAFPSVVRLVFRPFADGFEREHGMRVALVGATLVAAAAAAAGATALMLDLPG